MASVTFDGVTTARGDVIELNNLNLSIENQEFMVLLGPAGSGNSTALYSVAGLVKAAEGNIMIGDRVVNDIPYQDRDITIVFQRNAFYPRMNIADNMGGELKLRKTPKADISRRVEEAAQILGFAELLDRKPGELSTEQLRDVALGRAIVREPAAFLFDEFLSNLDATLRVQFYSRLTRLHQRLATTFIYATQDQAEALALATCIAVLRDGILQQVDSPINLYHHPSNVFVAGYIGAPTMNFFNGSITGSLDEMYVESGSLRLQLPQNLQEQLGEESIDRAVIFGIRPEDIHHPDYQPAEVEGQMVEARVDISMLQGNETCVSFLIDDQSFSACIDSRAELPRGDVIRLGFNARKVHIFDSITEKNIATAL